MRLILEQFAFGKQKEREGRDVATSSFFFITSVSTRGRIEKAGDDWVGKGI